MNPFSIEYAFVRNNLRLFNKSLKYTMYLNPKTYWLVNTKLAKLADLPE